MRTIEEQADHLLRKMTVDMSIDKWQTQQCAIAACEVILDEIKSFADNEIKTPIIIYWEKVKKELESR
jgi:hypothetical protein